MASELVYLGHDNTIDLRVEADGVAVGLGNVTKVTATIGDVLISSVDKAAGLITWDQPGYEVGEIRMDFGGEGLTSGAFDVAVIIYDSATPEGIVWEAQLPVRVVDELEGEPELPVTTIYTFVGTEDELLPNDGPLWIISADESSPPRADSTLPRYEVKDSRNVVNLRAAPWEIRVTDGFTTTMHLAGALAPRLTGNVDMMVVFFWHSIATVDFTIGLMAGPHDLSWGIVGKLDDTISGEFTLYRGDGIKAGGYDYGGRVYGYAWEEGEGFFAGSNWYRMRLRLDRTTGDVKLKWWADADDEPAIWNLEHNDINLATLGRLYPMIQAWWPLANGGTAYVESVTIEEF